MLLLALFVILTSCSSQSSTSPASTSATVTIVLPTATPTAVSVNLNPLTTAQAWGDVHIAQFGLTTNTLTFQPGGAYSQNAVTNDDQVCGSVSPPTTIDTVQRLLQIQMLELFNLHTGVLTNLYTAPAGYGINTCAVTDQWIVWTESYGIGYGDLQSNWRVKAINRQTQEVRLLDASKLPNGQQAPAKIIPFPSSGHGMAAWTTFLDNQGNTAAVIYDFATKQKTFQAQGTSFPLISWPWICWGDGTQLGIVFNNMETQQQTLLKENPATSAFNNSAFVVSNANYSAITVYPTIGPDMAAQSYVVGNGINGDFVEFPSVNDRLITWASNETVFAFDRKLQRPVKILEGLTGNPYPLVSGHYMIWAKHDPNNVLKTIMYVIDTNTLP